MIDDKDVKILTSLLPPESQWGVSHTLTDDGKSLIMGQFFVLEVERSQVHVKRWPDEPSHAPAFEDWRNTQLHALHMAIPAMALETSLRQIPDDDGEPMKVIKITGGAVVRYMRSEMYEILDKLYSTLRFKVFEATRPDGTPSSIAVYDGEDLVGAVALYDITLINK